MQSSFHGSINPACPRCDYDLRGQASTWVDHCPRHGVCSECGLRFAWGDLFAPSPTPRWSFEHAEWAGSSGLPAALGRAMLRIARPGILWGGLPLGAPVVAGRLVLFAVLSASVMLVLVMGAKLLVFAGEWYEMTRNPAFAVNSPPGLLSAFLGSPSLALLPIVNDWFVANGVGGRLLPAVCAASFAGLLPLTLVLLPMSLRRAKVRIRHLWRIAVYFAPCAVFFAWLPGIYSASTVVFWRLTYNNAGGSGVTGHVLAWFTPVAYRLPSLVCTATVVLTLVPAWIFWGFACSRYLRLPRPWLVAGALVVVAWLAVLATDQVLFAGRGMGTRIALELMRRW